MLTRIKLMGLACCLALSGGMFSRAALAADVCNNAAGPAYQQINQTYDPKIDLYLKVSGSLSAKGFDPKRYPFVTPEGNVEPVDLTELITKLAQQKAAGYKQVAASTSDCEKGFALPQKITDAAVFFSTGGLSAVLPSRMTHVDFSNLISGTPFGGTGALIPQLRDQALNGLGIGGDVACIIRDPKKIFGGC